MEEVTLPLELLFVKWLKLSFTTHYDFRKAFVPRERYQSSEMWCVVLTRIWPLKGRETA